VAQGLELDAGREEGRLAAVVISAIVVPPDADRRVNKSVRIN